LVRRLQAQFLRQGEGFWERPERGGRRHQNLTREEEVHLLQSFLSSAEQGGLLEVIRVKQAYEQALGPYRAEIDGISDAYAHLCQGEACRLRRSRPLPQFPQEVMNAAP